MQEQVDAEGMDFRQEAYQVLQAAAEPIDRPSHHNVAINGPLELDAFSSPLIWHHGRLRRIWGCE
jgi:hypothetical protein